MTNLWLLISCGEVFGISYVLALKTVLLIKKKGYPFIPVLIGSRFWLDFLSKHYGFKVSSLVVDSELINKIQHLSLLENKYLLLNVEKSTKINKSYIKKNHPKIVCDTLSSTLKFIKDFVNSNEKFAVITMPLAKNTVSKVFHNFVGHTEYLSEEFNLNKDDVAMLMRGKDQEGIIYNVLLLTRHVSLKDVVKKLYRVNVFNQVKNVVEFINKYEKNKIQKIIFGNINPHGGDEGVIGKEEKEIVLKNMYNISKKLKIKVQLVNNIADAFRYVKSTKQNILIVTTYHDQGMTPLKLICGYKIVNITVGLPFLRVSPGHGVAADLLFSKNIDFSGVELCIETICRFFGI